MEVLTEGFLDVKCNSLHFFQFFDSSPLNSRRLLWIRYQWFWWLDRVSPARHPGTEFYCCSCNGEVTCYPFLNYFTFPIPKRGDASTKKNNDHLDFFFLTRTRLENPAAQANPTLLRIIASIDTMLRAYPNIQVSSAVYQRGSAKVRTISIASRRRTTFLRSRTFMDSEENNVSRKSSHSNLFPGTTVPMRASNLEL